MPCTNPNPNSTICLPMGQDADRVPKIKVIFKGFFVSSIRHGASTAIIGALDPALAQGAEPEVRDALCHKPIIHIYRIDGDVTTEYTCFPIDLTQDISLNVVNDPKIEVFQRDEEPFNRLDEIGNDKKDFRWFVDLNDLHGRKKDEPATHIKVHQEKLKPKFVLNSGVFHSSKLSDGDVIIHHQNGHPPDRRFGRFATEITARLLVNGTNVAILQNGPTGTPLYIPGGDRFRWEIVFDCTCRSSNEEASDFSTVYKVISEQNNHPILDKIDFVPFEERRPPREGESTDLEAHQSAIDVERKTPEVYCIGGNCSVC